MKIRFPPTGMPPGPPDTAAQSGPVAFLLKGYPRLSETFIAQEIRALEQRGLDIRIYSLRRPTDPACHPVHREIAAPVNYLPEYLHEAPVRVWRGWRAARRLKGYAAARAAWLRDLRRDPTRNRLRRFGQALVLAAELPAEVCRLHAHFLHTPSSVARYAALLRGIAWSASAHAKDVWTTPPWDLQEKLDSCRWLVTCTAANARYLAALAPEPRRIALLYHGLDLARFPPPPTAARRPPRNGRDAANPVIILSVGRAVEKKGYAVLLQALALLAADLYWQFVHVGAGPLLPELQHHAGTLGIAHRVCWMGAQAQDAVLDAYRRADLFVLACRIAADGDRDGLPNVLMEAQSQAVACVSTDVSAIPELIDDGETGVLVPPDDAQRLAWAIERLVRFPELRRRLALAGQQRVRAVFSLEGSIDRLAARFGLDAERACISRSTPR